MALRRIKSSSNEKDSKLHFLGKDARLSINLNVDVVLNGIKVVQVNHFSFFSTKASSTTYNVYRFVCYILRK